MDPFIIYRNDDNPPLLHRVYDDANSVYLDITDAATFVVAKFRSKNTTDVLFTKICTKKSASFGLVQMDWPSESLYDLDGGRYELQLFVARSSTTGSISAATAASPVVITVSVAHGLSTGNKVHISGVVGMTELNDKEYIITVVDSTSFSLDDIDGSDFTAWSSGGTWRKFGTVQTSASYHWNGAPEDEATTIPILVKEDF